MKIHTIIKTKLLLLAGLLAISGVVKAAGDDFSIDVNTEASFIDALYATTQPHNSVTINITASFSITAVRSYDYIAPTGGPVTINGNSKTITGGSGDYKFLSVNLGAKASINNLTITGFKNNSTNETYGGAIINRGDLTLNNVTFQNNILSKDYSSGGAIFSEGTINTYGAVKFLNNQATYFGGGIYISPGATMTINSGSVVTFSGNTGGFGNDIANNGLITIKLGGALSYGNGPNDLYNTGTITDENPPVLNYEVTKTGDNASEEGTLRNVINKANANLGNPVTISFASNITEVNVSTSVNGTAFVLSDRTADLTIDGGCAVTIKNVLVGGNLQCFENKISNANANLYLKGITIRDFKSDKTGAAINCMENSKLTLEDVSFLNNTSSIESYTTGGGGAIYGSKSTINLYQRIYFEANQAENGLGGAVSLIESTLYVSEGCNLVFMNNSAQWGGGAIYASSSNMRRTYDGSSKNPAISTFTANKVLTETDIVVVNDKNESVGRGGAILHTVLQSGSAEDLQIGFATFNSNKAVHGGAIFVAGTPLKIASCSFTGNNASGDDILKDGKTITNGYGGAIYALKEVTLLNDKNVFTNNYAKHSGGALYYAQEGETAITNKPLAIKGTFRGNKAYQNAGAIYVAVPQGATVTSSGVYEYNEATWGNGGFLNTHEGPIEVNADVSLRNNKAGYAGGALYCYNHEVTATGAQFLFNKQEKPLDENSFEVEEGYGGGAIAVCGTVNEDGSVSKAAKLTLSGCYFETNKAIKGGAVISMQKGDVITIDHDTITVNKNLTRFFGNLASFVNKDNKLEFGQGGAIFARGPLTIKAGKIPDENVGTYFPQIYANRAISDGGGIYCEGNFIAEKVDFRNNISYKGGGLYLRLDVEETATITDSRFRGNNYGWGGAVALENVKVVDGKNVYEPTGKVYSYRTQYYNNRATSGGAIYAQMAGETAIEECLFEGNLVNGNPTGVKNDPQTGGAGGAIYSAGGFFKIGVDTRYPGKNIFRNNYAFNGNGMGGAICTNGVAEIKGALFENNAAGYVQPVMSEDGKTVIKYEVIPQHVIAFGNNDLTKVEKVSNNIIKDSKGTIPNPWVEGETIDFVANGVGYHRGYRFTNPNDDTKWVIGNSEISENEISGNNYGVVIDSYVIGTFISKNTFTKNARAIYTGQHVPRLAANDELMKGYGNQGLGMPLVYSATANGSTLEFEAALPSGLNADASLELYKSDTETDNNSAIIYLGSVDLSQGVTPASFPTTCESKISASITLPEGVTFDNQDEYLLTLAIAPVTKINGKDIPEAEAGRNTSELIGQAIKLQLNITDEIKDPARGEGSGINWNDAKFVGTFDGAGSYADITNAVFTEYPGCETMEVKDGKISQTIYVNPKDTKDWKIGLQTADNKLYGVWSFDGLSGDTINTQTYRVVQDYLVDPTDPKVNRINNKAENDYKLLAIVDGTKENHFRNNQYVPTISSDIGYAGGGLVIKKDSENKGITLSVESNVTGSDSKGKLSAGLLVVEDDADFYVDGAAAELDMTSYLVGTTQETGPRLIIEKTLKTLDDGTSKIEKCGIFATTGGGTLKTDDNLMSLYHHVMNQTDYLWMIAPQSIALTYNGQVDNLLYSARSAGHKYKSLRGAYGKNAYIYAYDEIKRADIKPTDTGVWNSFNEILSGKDYTRLSQGFTIGAYHNKYSARDLYIRVAEPEIFFAAKAGDVKLKLSFTESTVLNNYQAATSFCEDKTRPNSIKEASVEAKQLIANYVSGWNLVGNPYSQSLNPKASEMGALAIRNAAGDGYTYLNVEETILGKKRVEVDGDYTSTLEFYGDESEGFNIPPLTAFYIQAKVQTPFVKGEDARPTVYYDQPIKGTFTSENVLLRSARPKPGIIRVDLLKDNQIIDQTVLSFSEGATGVMDWGLDVPFMRPDVKQSQIYLPDLRGEAMAINVMAESSENFTAPISLEFDAAAEYGIRISEITNINADQLFLKDGNNQTPVEEGRVYPFAISKAGTSVGNYAIIGKTEVKNPTDEDKPKRVGEPSAFAKNGEISVYNLSGQAEITLTDAMGRVTYQANCNEETHSISGQNAGYYTVKVIQNKEVHTIKVIIRQ